MRFLFRSAAGKGLNMSNRTAGHSKESRSLMGTSMPKRGLRRRIFQLFAVLLVPAQVLVGIPLQAAEAVPAVEDPNATTPPPEPPKVTVNREVPAVDPVPAYAQFSGEPTNEEITEARVFAEPLAPLGGVEDAEANKGLAKAIRDYQSGGDTENLTPFDLYLSAFPKSPWRGSLLANIGVVYRRKGYFTRAEAALTEAWVLLKDATADPLIEGAASRALSELLQLHMDFGQQAPLEDLLAQVEGRELNGGVSSRVLEAQSMVWSLKNAHHTAIPSGTVALRKIAAVKEGKETRKPELDKFHATHDGASIVQMRDLARQVGLKLRIAKRESLDAPIPYPAMAHLVGAHFTAVVREEDGKVKLDDPLLGGGNGAGEVWMSHKALAEESSGFFLIEDGTLPKGWRAASDKEARVIRGKCKIAQQDWGETGEGAVECGGDCDNCEDTSEEDEDDPEDDPYTEYDEGNEPPPPMGMARYSLQMLVANLRIRDTPMGYRPPRGPAVRFRIFYSHMEAYQPQTFTFANTGSRWSSGWVSYLEDDPNNPNQPIQLMRRGGGRHTYSGIAGGISARHKYTRAQLVRTSVSPVRYERRLANGAIEVFEQADGAYTMPRRVFMTQSIDPQGNRLRFNYDSQLRLASVADAINQVTTLSYGHGTDKRKITKVTDPFGRSARLDYSGTKLVGLTDTIGVRSSFEYSSGGDFIRGIRTPYGRNTFSKGGGPQLTDHWVEARDGAGGRQRAHYQLYTGGLDNAYPAASVPKGFGGENALLAGRNSFYWGRRAAAAGHASDHAGVGGNFAAATRFHWLWEAYLKISGRPALIAAGSSGGGSGKRIWHAHAGEVMAGAVGATGRPARIGTVLGDGRSRVRRYEYNTLGKITRYTNSAGHELIIGYASNGIDRVSTKRKTANGYAVLESRTYDTKHRPLSRTNAANKTDLLTYNAFGQVLTAANPRGQAITYSYNGSGYLQRISYATVGITFTYDGYGRIRTVTNDDNESATVDYNALDLPTRMTYSDGSYVEAIYEGLRVSRIRDRAGRWTRYGRDAEGRLTSVRLANDQVIQLQWCNCGTLDRLVDPNGIATTWERDASGRLIKLIRGNGAAIVYQYEPGTNRVSSVTDEKGQTKMFTYTLDGRLAGVSYQNAQYPTPNVSFTYEPVFGQISSMTGETGTTTFTHHPVGAPGAGLVATEDGPGVGDALQYTYDDLARTIRAVVGSATFTYEYDDLGRPESVTSSQLGAFRYSYVGTSERRSRINYPNGATTTLDYHSTGVDTLLKDIHHRAPGGSTLALFSYDYDPNRNIKTWHQKIGDASATVDEFTYDGGDQMTGATRRTAGDTPSVLGRRMYVYDPAGNRTAVQRDDVVAAGVFDRMNRLERTEGGGQLAFAGSTDEPASVVVQSKPAVSAGANRFAGSAQVGVGVNTVEVRATDASGNTRARNYQVSMPGGGSAFQYDANGNMTRRVEGSDVWTYDWDAEDRLRRVARNGAEVVRYAYDAFGRRAVRHVGGATTSFIYSGADLVTEVGGGVSYTYVHGPGMDEPHARTDAQGNAAYYFGDHLGSVRRITDAAGAVLHSYQYGDWGEIESGADVAGYAYTGREWDPQARLYYYRSRYYAPEHGRFLSEDPLGWAGGSNFYRYAEGNPMRFVDPSGELVWFAPIIIGAVVSGLVDIAWQLMVNGCRVECIDIGSVLIAMAVGGLFGAMGPSGAIFGRAGQKAANMGYRGGWLNTGNFRIGWSWNKGRNWFSIHGGKPRTPSHWHRDLFRGPADHGYWHFSGIGSLVGSAAGAATADCQCK